MLALIAVATSWINTTALDCNAMAQEHRITSFWVCMGPWALENHATSILLQNSLTDAIHVHNPAFVSALIGVSPYCQCTAGLEILAACGEVPANKTLTAFQPWCAVADTCTPLRTSALLRTATACTEEHLSVVNESDILCPPPPPPRSSYGAIPSISAEFQEAYRDSLAQGHIAPIAPNLLSPGAGAHMCAHAVQDLFNVSTSGVAVVNHVGSLCARQGYETDTAACFNALAQNVNAVAGAAANRAAYGMGTYMHALRYGAYDELSACVAQAGVAESALQLPISLDELFGNGSILTYDSLTSHVCASPITHGWLLDSIEKNTGLRWAEEQWMDPDGNNWAANGIVTAWIILLVFLCALCGFCMCWGGGFRKCWETEDMPVMTPVSNPASNEPKPEAGEGDVAVEMTSSNVRVEGSVA